MSRFDGPQDVDGDRLLDAIASVETSGGVNNWPRIERAYMPLGLTLTIQGHIVEGTGTMFNDVVRPRWKRWGPASAASYSSWQLLYHVAADLGYDGDPRDLWHDEIALPFVVKRLVVIRDKQGALSVSDFADAWNSGTFKDSIVPQQYIDAVLNAYGKTG